jgi:hypothetical protein
LLTSPFLFQALLSMKQTFVNRHGDGVWSIFVECIVTNVIFLSVPVIFREFLFSVLLWFISCQLSCRWPPAFLLKLTRLEASWRISHVVVVVVHARTYSFEIAQSISVFLFSNREERIGSAQASITVLKATFNYFLVLEHNCILISR